MSDSIDSQEPSQTLSPHKMAALNEITKILVAVSVVLIPAGGLLQLDFLPGILLGVTIVGLNFYLTRQVLLRILLYRDLKRRVLVFYLLKFGFSAIVLYVAVVHFKVSGLGLLIGLSNIVIAILIYSIKQTLFPPVKQA